MRTLELNAALHDNYSRWHEISSQRATHLSGGIGIGKQEEKMKRVTVLLAAGLVALAAAGLPTVRAYAQQPVVTAENLNDMVANAKTAADHEAIAAFYKQLAEKDRKDAEVHKSWAETYKKLKLSKPVGMARMCNATAKYDLQAAEQAEELAKAHEEMAKAAGAK